MSICAGPIDWGTTWAAVTAIAGLTSVVVLAFAAVFAKHAATQARAQVEATRDTSKITLTNEALNSLWFREAVAILVKALATTNNDAARARAEIELRIKFRAARKEIDPGLDEIETKAIATYVYLSHLYKRDVLDNDLLVEAGRSTVVMLLYVFEPVLRLTIDAGIHDESVLEFGRVCIDAYTRPQVLATHAFLDGWTI
jgi:hypothetical protein